MTEIVYILTNPGMPGLVKVGKNTTGDLALRIRQLYQTGVPAPFDLYFAAEVHDADFVEDCIFQAFDFFRENPRREFLRVDPENVKAALMIGMVREITLDEEQGEVLEQGLSVEEREAIQSRRRRFRFEDYGIPVGSLLVLRKDSTITAKVAADNQIEYEGEVMSPTAATKAALSRTGRNWPSPVAAWEWLYNGRRLEDLRRERETR
jgi:hypothetical protein